MPRKSKRFQTLKAAERRVKLLGPEPWTAFDRNPDEPYCCSGYECACGGMSVRDTLLEQRKVGHGDPDDTGMPDIEYIRIEKRPLGAWSVVNGT